MTEPLKIRRTLNKRVTTRITSAMQERLREVMKRRDIQHETEAVREAIRLFLDGQEDLLGSKGYFNKTVQRSLAAQEVSLRFWLMVLITLEARGQAMLLKRLAQLAGDHYEPEATSLIREAVLEASKHAAGLAQFVEQVRSKTP